MSINYPFSKLPQCKNDREPNTLYIDEKNTKVLWNGTCVRKVCIFEFCKVRPVYDFPGSKCGIYCYKHKKPFMINVIDTNRTYKYNKSKHVLCDVENCKKHASFNYEFEKKRKYCFEHKKPNMINIAYTKCIHENCYRKACYNYFDQNTALYCSSHKIDNMINITTRKCSHQECYKYPSFNYENEKRGMFCYVHKKENMVNVVEKICKTPMCITQVTDKYKGYCVYCFSHLFPNEPLSRNFKTKERHVVDFICSNFGNLQWIQDKTIIGGTSKRRPDLMCDIGSHVIIIEIDEHAHSSYDNTCENKRIMQISQDLEFRPIVFIRFNPDSYNNGNTMIESCWSICKKTGLCMVYKNHEIMWKMRLETLKNTIEKWISNDNIPDKMITVEYLFFDTSI